jgi:lipopolysaccharide transport system permease protein
MFGKVYFPRLIVPFSVMLLNYFQFSIQFFFLLLAVAYYHSTGQISADPINLLLSIPVIIVVSFIGLGAGLVLSVLTAKYRDISSFLPFIVRLLMFLCPVFYSLTTVPGSVRWLVNLNPLTVQFEAFRYALTNQPGFDARQFLYSCVIMFLLVIAGLLFFNKKGDQLIDVA